MINRNFWHSRVLTTNWQGVTSRHIVIGFENAFYPHGKTKIIIIQHIINKKLVPTTEAEIYRLATVGPQILENRI